MEPKRFSGASSRSTRARPPLASSSSSAADPGGEDAVDLLVVAATAVQDAGRGEVGVADDGEQGLRQVVVDVRVDADQHVPQRRLVGRGVEGEPPGPGHVGAAAVAVGVVGPDEELGEDHVPALDPGRVLEPAGVDGLAHRQRRPQVGPEEEAAMSQARRQRVEALLHLRDDLVDRPLGRACQCCTSRPGIV